MKRYSNPLELYLKRDTDSFRWHPGSATWDQAHAGGDLYNPTGLIEPWEVMNGNSLNLDYTGLLTGGFFDLNNPASPSWGFPGNDFNLFGELDG